jgi:glycerophosphoryl diester phosphodiesterase
MGDLEPVLAFSPIYDKEINEAYEKIPGFKMPRKNYHYFAATPSQYAKNVMISVESRFGQTWVYDFDMGSYIDVQARIGGDDLTSDKAVEAVRVALDMGVNTLNLDFHVTMDGQVKLSHKEGADASEIIDFVENYTAEKGMSPVRYNVEIKSKDADGEGRKWPTYDSYVRSCALLLHSKQLEDRIVVQSFDTRALRYMEERYPEFALSYLLDVKDTDYEAFMKKLKGTSVEWLSPHVSVTDEDFVRKCHEKGMRIAPWGADTPEDIKKMTDLKVDAVISECPEKVLMQTRLY